MTPLEERIAQAILDGTNDTLSVPEAEELAREAGIVTPLDLARRVLAVLRDAPAEQLAEALGMEQVGWWTPHTADPVNIGGMLDGPYDDDDEPVYRFRSEPTDA